MLKRRSDGHELIAFVVLRLHCQLKVVPEGSLLILSERGIEHAKEALRRARVGCVCQHSAQHKCKVRKLSRVAPPPIRQHKSVFALGILSLVQRLDRLHQSMVLATRMSSDFMPSM